MCANGIGDNSCGGFYFESEADFGDTIAAEIMKNISHLSLAVATEVFNQTPVFITWPNGKTY